MKKDAKSIGFYSWLPSLAPDGQLEYRHDDDPLSELSRIAGLIPSWREGRRLKRLEDAIAPLRARYGPPYHLDRDDDQAWLTLAVEVGTHLETVASLQAGDLEEVGGPPTSGLERTRQSLLDWRADVTRPFLSKAAKIKESDERNLEDPWLHVLHQHEKDPVAYRELCERDLLLRIARRSDTPQEFKKAVGDQLFAAFGGQVAGPGMTGSRLIPTPTGTIVETSLGVWVTYLLSRMWHHGADVRPCDGCGTLFPPGRKGRVFCRKTCADRSYRRRKAAP